MVHMWVRVPTSRATSRRLTDRRGRVNEVRRVTASASFAGGRETIIVRVLMRKPRSTLVYKAGAAVSFPMRWEDLLRRLQDLPPDGSEVPGLPNTAEALSRWVQVLVKTSDREEGAS